MRERESGQLAGDWSEWLQQHTHSLRLVLNELKIATGERETPPQTTAPLPHCHGDGWHRHDNQTSMPEEGARFR